MQLHCEMYIGGVASSQGEYGPRTGQPTWPTYSQVWAQPLAGLPVRPPIRRINWSPGTMGLGKPMTQTIW